MSFVIASGSAACREVKTTATLSRSVQLFARHFAVDCGHGIGAAAPCILSDNRFGKGPSAPADRRRIPSSCESAGRQAHSFHRCGARATGEEGEASVE